MARHSTDVGNPMLINLPAKDEREALKYKDSGEGGLAFWLVIPTRDRGEDRQTCSAGSAYWPQMDVVVKGQVRGAVDGALLIGSTGESLYSDVLGSYFAADKYNLTPKGRKLFEMLEVLYGEGEVEVVTLLDT